MITIKAIDSRLLDIRSVITAAIGQGDIHKINNVIKSYQESDDQLLGAFTHNKLIGILGYTCCSIVVIRHLSVIADYRLLGVGTNLVKHLLLMDISNIIVLETDIMAVDFYKKLGFNCKSFIGKYNIRYKCMMNKNDL